MKFKISVSDLQYALKQVKDIASGSAVIDASLVRVEAKDNAVEFFAYNASMLAKVTVNAEVVTQGSVITDCDAVYTAVAKFKPLSDKGTGTSPVLFSLNVEKHRLAISTKTTYKSGDSIPHRRVFPVYDDAAFPTFPEPGNSAVTIDTIPARTIVDGFDSVGFAVSSDEKMALFTGVYVKFSPGTLTMAATNGVCIAEYVSELEQSTDEISAIIPGRFAAKISRSFFEDDELCLSVDKRLIYVSSPNLSVAANLIAGDFPDYKAVLPKEEEATVLSLDKEVLLDNLLNLDFEASKDPSNRTNLKFSGGEVEVVAGAATNTGIKTDFKGFLDFDVNLLLFTQAIRHLRSDEVKLIVVGRKPIQLLPSEKLTPSFWTALVPLNKR